MCRYYQISEERLCEGFMKPCGLCSQTQLQLDIDTFLRLKYGYHRIGTLAALIEWVAMRATNWRIIDLSIWQASNATVTHG